jgi:hypothetical protein
MVLRITPLGSFLLHVRNLGGSRIPRTPASFSFPQRSQKILAQATSRPWADTGCGRASSRPVAEGGHTLQDTLPALCSLLLYRVDPAQGRALPLTVLLPVARPAGFRGLAGNLRPSCRRQALPSSDTAAAAERLGGRILALLPRHGPSIRDAKESWQAAALTYALR